MTTNRGMGINLYEEVLESIKIVNDDDNGLELVQMERIAEWVAARLQMKLDDVISRKIEKITGCVVDILGSTTYK